MRPKYLVINGTRALATSFFADLVDFRVVSWDSDADLVLSVQNFDIDKVLQVFGTFQPDLIFVFWPEFHALPEGLFACGVPVVAAISDWNLGTRAILNHLDLYDLVLMDREGARRFKNLGYPNVEYAPLYSYEPGMVHAPDDLLQRPIDIGFVGNLNGHVQRQRAIWIDRLAYLHKRHGWIVKVATGVYREEYWRFLQSCKIVFNLTIRSEMNLRCYEAPAAGSVLLLEEDNDETPWVMQPNIEYQTYTVENFEEVVANLLSNEEKLQEMAVRGHERIVPSESYKVHAARIINLITERVPRARGTRTFRAEIGLQEQRLWSVTQDRYAITSRSMTRDSIAQEVESEDESLFLNSLAASLIGYAATQPNFVVTIPGEYWQRVRMLLQSALAKWSTNIAVYFNQLQLAFSLGQYQVVIDTAPSAFDAITKANTRQAFAGAIALAGFDEFRSDIESVFSDLRVGHLDKLRSSFFCRILVLRGDCYQNLQQWVQARQDYQLALHMMPHWASIWYKYAAATLVSGPTPDALEIAKDAIAKNPLMISEQIQLYGIAAQVKRSDVKALIAHHIHNLYQISDYFAQGIQALQNIDQALGGSHEAVN
ncbi:hypothetical protein BXT84_14730 [Sulfobacillus thermotolerans]|uniref:Spore protein YkvP/CgeB glycosyl transferase-like domain-containing protein n=1 Tax=Sulfobacillus thermotolerans TaxID=338644 RepID=A0ABM6RUA9_9FIRM|nr:hypothetical protein BXT84_14730 [Sulfobacillus thermotolerans]